MTKSKFNQIMDILEKNNFDVPMDNNGEIHYCLIRVNENTIPDMPESFKQQLMNEHKYNSYVAFCTSDYENFSMTNLPVYGSSSRWVTKWLYNSAEEAVKADIRQLNLYTRFCQYTDNLKYI